MPRYSYVALDARGQESSGVIEAESQNDAVGQLRQSGYFPKSIVEEGKGPKAKTKSPAKAQSAAKKDIKINIPFLQKKTIKPKTLMIFTGSLRR